MRLNKGRVPLYYFWQNKEKKEIDLIIDKGERIIPIEIKSSKTRQPHLLENLLYWKKLTGEQGINLDVIYCQFY
jgi:predicted AAA+ superfamily ATPase